MKADVNVTGHTLTARKQHLCGGGEAGCARIIEPGQEYARLVAFPGADSYNGDRPWVMRLCEPCQTQYGRPMPPRRRRMGEAS